jgi:two-component system NtrC family sensor kinase
MNGKGTLEIGVSLTPSLPNWEGNEEGVLIQITDSGSGISDNIKDRIFEPFFTTKPGGEGSGLGLDICKKIVEKHQGKIQFESQPGRMTFSVWLPVLEP